MVAGKHKTYTGEQLPPARPPDNCTVRYIADYASMIAVLTDGWELCDPAAADTTASVCY